ncbi:hypothetical protein Tco_0773446 [Tanacetum coccineum]|uniref:Uncharacterized protein n=1 Tax=Tanacetum coccineum TaxID=301880 RepID=A0ABQ4ZKX1_9ASTR
MSGLVIKEPTRKSEDSETIHELNTRSTYQPIAMHLRKAGEGIVSNYPQKERFFHGHGKQQSLQEADEEKLIAVAPNTDAHREHEDLISWLTAAKKLSAA